MKKQHRRPPARKANNETASRSDPENARERLGSLAWILDSSIRLPGGFRIGLDGLIGLIPGFGDVASAVLSGYIVFEAARLGASTGVLMRMLGNIALEMLVGVVPLLGDVFDFAFKANVRNVALLDRYLETPRRGARSNRALVIVLLVAIALLMVLSIWLTVQVLLWVSVMLQAH